MNKSFEKLRISIYLLMCMLITFLIFAYLNEIFTGTSSAWILGALTIIFIVISNYFLRKYVTNLILFLSAHIIMVIFPFVLPITFLSRLILAIITFSYLIMGINYWKLEENEHKNYLIETPLSLAFLFILAYIHSSYAFSNSLSTYSYISGIAYFILYYTREYLDKFRLMSINTSNNKNEISKTFSTNISLVIFLDFISMAVVSISYIFYSDNLIKKISSIFKKFFRYIFSLFLKDESTAIVTETATTSSNTFSSHTTAIDNSFIENKRNFPIIDIIFEALVYIIFIAIFFIIIYIVYSFIKNHLNQNRTSNDIIEKVTNTDTKQKSKKIHTQKSISLFTPNDIKLRKIYAGKVNNVTSANSDIIIFKSFTSNEISSSILKDTSTNKDNIDKLTGLYQKARYSNHNISKDDISNATKYSK